METTELPEDDDGMIFKFFDGSKQREIDLWDFTLTIADKLSSSFQAKVDAVQDGDLVAAREIVRETRSLLNIDKFQSVDGVRTGLPDGKVIGLFYKMMVDIDEQKKTLGLSQTLPPSTEQPSCNNPLLEDNASDSGLTSKDNSLETPSPPPSELPPPLEQTS